MTNVANSSVKVRANNPSQGMLGRVAPPGTGSVLRAVLFGPPKTGKTTVATNGTGKKLMVLTDPDGDLSVRGVKDLDVLKPESWRELNDIMTELTGGGYKGYKWVIFDTITSMFELVANKNLYKATMENRDPRRVYGSSGTAVNHLLHDAVHLPVHTIFVAQLKIDTPDEQDDTPLDPTLGEYPMTLAVTPMVYKVLTPAVSVIGRTIRKPLIAADGNRTSQFLVSFDDFGKSPAGSRIEVPSLVENLKMDDLVAHLQGG
jgi:hypothetical protein